MQKSKVLAKERGNYIFNFSEYQYLARIVHWYSQENSPKMSPTESNKRVIQEILTYQSSKDAETIDGRKEIGLGEQQMWTNLNVWIRKLNKINMDIIKTMEDNLIDSLKSSLFRMNNNYRSNQWKD